jgi:hypothetical protein
MSVQKYTAKNIILSTWINPSHPQATEQSWLPNNWNHFDFLVPIRNWLNNITIGDRNLAHRLCKLIPNQCPFERKIELFGRTLVSIPPMCKLNPLYDEVIALRFRAICYLADVCGEDVSLYC